MATGFLNLGPLALVNADKGQLQMEMSQTCRSI
jgi:hypothetical protein